MTATLARPTKPVIREGTSADFEAIMRLRRMQERELVGQVGPPVNVTWFVVETGGAIVAAAAVCLSTALGHERTAIITDFLDDGTRAGKRGLLLMLNDALSSNCSLYVSLPVDRPGLAKVLVRRGLDLTAWQFERRLPHAQQ